MKRTLRTAVLFSLACATIFAVSNFAQAQRVDFGFAVSGMQSASAASGNCGTLGDTSCSHQNVSMTGGTYLGFNGDVLFWHNVGFGAEINWLASQKDYGGQGFGYRPIFYNFNAVYSPKIAPRVYADLVAGIGAVDTHYYTGTYCGAYTCSNYQSINHFDGDFGGGLKLMATKSIFIRPEARVYLIHNNQEFSSDWAIRYGATIGFSFR